VKTAQAAAAPAFNPYAAPAAAVSDAAAASGEAVFFPVGLLKLTLMGIEVVVHFPDLALRASGRGRLSGVLGVGVYLREREVAEHDA